MSVRLTGGRDASGGLVHTVRLIPPSYEMRSYSSAAKRREHAAAIVRQSRCIDAVRPDQTKEQAAGLMLRRDQQLLVASARC